MAAFGRPGRLHAAGPQTLPASSTYTSGNYMPSAKSSQLTVLVRSQRACTVKVYGTAALPDGVGEYAFVDDLDATLGAVDEIGESDVADTVHFITIRHSLGGIYSSIYVVVTNTTASQGEVTVGASDDG